MLIFYLSFSELLLVSLLESSMGGHLPACQAQGQGVINKQTAKFDPRNADLVLLKFLSCLTGHQGFHMTMHASQKQKKKGEK